MEEKNIETEKSMDEFMLPGFRFHPTDEELVEFYLKRKLQHRSLPIELIKQVDIYKYDPWDLPKLASTGEKEWYFYCPRDRKYRNSARPNRVTGSGFWKATGTDRPIYSSDGSKCIGLKKSLVFYRGRAAKGLKTDWMMHEFRLPSSTDGPRKIVDKNLPPNDSWAICRIFKKTVSTAHRALSHSWAAETSSPTMDPTFGYNTHHFNSDDIIQHTEFSALNNIPSYKSCSVFPGNLVFSSPEEASVITNKTTVDLSSMIFNLSSPSLTGEGLQEFNGHSGNSSNMLQACENGEDEQENGFRKNQSAATTMNIHNVWENMRSMGFPFSLPAAGEEAWKGDLPWDSPSCPSEISSTAYSATSSSVIRS